MFHASFVDPMLAIALAAQDIYSKRYLDFIRNANMEFLYADLRLFYQSMLFARKPDTKQCTQLCIKSPFHSAVNFRAALLKVFPDVRFVLVHRSLKASLGSFVSVAKTINSFVCAGMDVAALTDVATDPWLFDTTATPANTTIQLPFKMLMIDAVKVRTRERCLRVWLRVCVYSSVTVSHTLWRHISSWMTCTRGLVGSTAATAKLGDCSSRTTAQISTANTCTISRRAA